MEVSFKDLVFLWCWEHKPKHERKNAAGVMMTWIGWQTKELITIKTWLCHNHAISTHKHFEKFYRWWLTVLMDMVKVFPAGITCWHSGTAANITQALGHWSNLTQALQLCQSHRHCRYITRALQFFRSGTAVISLRHSGIQALRYCRYIVQALKLYSSGFPVLNLYHSGTQAIQIYNSGSRTLRH